MKKNVKTILRYPSTRDATLQAYNAADELLLSHYHTIVENQQNPLLYNDRFGYLACHLHDTMPGFVVNYASQQKALSENLRRNDLDVDSVRILFPFDPVSDAAIALLKVPKSLELFEFQVQHAAVQLAENGVLMAGFMTKYFTPNLLKVAERYFKDVQQTKAHKKARLMVLRHPKKADFEPKIKQVQRLDGTTLQQYPGVFSAERIDFGTELLLKFLKLPKDVRHVLDVGCGNGVILEHVRREHPEAVLHGTDDNWLAVASAKLNLPASSQLEFTDTLDHIAPETMDVVVSNPPFHFDYETNTDVTIRLFKEIRRCLKPGGKLVMVANRHLPYWVQLKKMFGRVEVLEDDGKFVVLECEKNS